MLGGRGTMADQLTETSMFLSYVLRHEPEAIGIELDREGWVEIDVLIVAAARHARTLTRDLVEEVVATNAKKRFAISADGRCIRAVQGHSTDSVAIAHDLRTPPEFLFHGTATRFLDSIREKGLLPGARHHVHLSGDAATATEVGRRHGKPVVLRVRATQMVAAGHEFYQADNGVWLTASVPPKFIEEIGFTQ